MGIFTNFRKTLAENTAKTASDKKKLFGSLNIAKNTAEDDKKPKAKFLGNILSDAK